MYCLSPQISLPYNITGSTIASSWGAIFSVRGEKGGRKGGKKGRSWGAIFSVRGRKREKKGRGQRSKWGGKLKKVQRKAVDEQQLLLSSFSLIFELASYFGGRF